MDGAREAYPQPYSMPAKGPQKPHNFLRSASDGSGSNYGVDGVRVNGRFMFARDSPKNSYQDMATLLLEEAISAPSSTATAEDATEHSSAIIN